MEEGQRDQAAPQTVSELFDRLDRVAVSLPKRLRQCAEFLHANGDLVAVSTVADMARASGVAPSAFMRFCQALGFSGYSQMRALFRAQYAQRRPGYAQRLEALRASGAPDAAQLLLSLAEAGHRSLADIGHSLDSGLLERVVETMRGADVIHVVGMRRALSVASYMSYLLAKMEQPCLLHAGVGAMDHARAIRPGSLLFAVTFAPFSAETIALAQYARAVGASVVLLTDSADCPIADIAEEVVIAREVEVGSFRVPTASLTLVTAISVTLGERAGPG